MFERFTDEARRVVVLAQEEARLLDHHYIGTEHVLLGLLAQRDGVAAAVLASLGVTLEGARSKVEEIIGRSESSPGGQIPFTPRAKTVLELSLRESLQLGHTYIGTEHLLLGVIREGEGVAVQVLVTQGAGLSEVRQKVIQLITGGVVSPDPEDDPSAPHCAHCGRALAETLRTRSLAAPDAESGQVRSVVIAYCGSCGRALGPLR